MTEAEINFSCGLCGKGFPDLGNVEGNIRQHFVAKHFGLHGMRGRRNK